MSIHAQFAPYQLKEGDWDSRREELGDTIVNTLSAYAPNLKELIVGRQVFTPLDLERTYGLSGGHIHHGEMSLDQLFAFRPVIGYGAVSNANRRALFVRFGNSSRRWRDRSAGIQCESRDNQGFEGEVI